MRPLTFNDPSGINDGMASRSVVIDRVELAPMTTAFVTASESVVVGTAVVEDDVDVCLEGGGDFFDAGVDDFLLSRFCELLRLLRSRFRISALSSRSSWTFLVTGTDAISCVVQGQ